MNLPPSEDTDFQVRQEEPEVDVTTLFFRFYLFFILFLICLHKGKEMGEKNSN